MGILREFLSTFSNIIPQKEKILRDQEARVMSPHIPHTKSEILDHWKSLSEGQRIKLRPIGMGHEGSTYLEDTIRLTGTREFIDSILVRLKDLLVFEGEDSRLAVVYREIQDRETGRPTGRYVAYIQVWEKGKN